MTDDDGCLRSDVKQRKKMTDRRKYVALL
jgi:hypothetical protein